MHITHKYTHTHTQYIYFHTHTYTCVHITTHMSILIAKSIRNKHLNHYLNHQRFERCFDFANEILSWKIRKQMKWKEKKSKIIMKQNTQYYSQDFVNAMFVLHMYFRNSNCTCTYLSIYTSIYILLVFLSIDSISINRLNLRMTHMQYTN